MKPNNVVVCCSSFLVPDLRKWNFRCVINWPWSIWQMISIPTFSSKMSHFCRGNFGPCSWMVFTVMRMKILIFPQIFHLISLQHLAGFSLVASLIFRAGLKDIKRDATRGWLMRVVKDNFCPENIMKCFCQGFETTCGKSHRSIP